MKFVEFLNENLMDERENSKFSMSAKVNGKQMAAKKMDGRYVYYSEISKRWMPISKTQITFTERDKTDAPDKKPISPAASNRDQPEKSDPKIPGASANKPNTQVPGSKSTLYNASDRS